MYSQNDEEKYILEYFDDVTAGTFLDIGAFDPFVFSNTRALYERGFKGVFIEPAPGPADKFRTQYQSDPDIQVLQVCVGAQSGEVDFYDSGGDAISTTVQSHTELWSNVTFGITKARMVTVNELLSLTKYKHFDFLNIDTEGNVREIVEQFDLKRIGCRLACVEWAGKDFAFYDEFFRDADMKPIAQNAENLIYGRRYDDPLDNLIDHMSRNPRYALKHATSAATKYSHYAEFGELLRDIFVSVILDAYAGQGDFACTMYGYAGFGGRIVSLEPGAFGYDHMCSLVDAYPQWEVSRAGLAGGAPAAPEMSREGGAAVGDQAPQIDPRDWLQRAIAETAVDAEIGVRLNLGGGEIAVIERMGALLDRCAFVLVRSGFKPGTHIWERQALSQTMYRLGFYECGAAGAGRLRPAIPQDPEILFLHKRFVI